MKTHTTKSIFVTTVVIAVALIALNYLLFTIVKTTNERTAGLSEEVLLYEKRQNELSGRGGMADINVLIEKVNSYFIGKDDVVKFIENIEREAREGGVGLAIRSVETETFGSKDGEKTVVDKTKETMRLKLEATGTWRNTTRFITFLEHLPYKVTVVEIGLSKTTEIEKGSKLPIWRARIELTVPKHK